MLTAAVQSLEEANPAKAGGAKLRVLAFSATPSPRRHEETPRSPSCQGSARQSRFAVFGAAEGYCRRMLPTRPNPETAHVQAAQCTMHPPTARSRGHSVDHFLLRSGAATSSAGAASYTGGHIPQLLGPHSRAVLRLLLGWIRRSWQLQLPRITPLAPEFCSSRSLSLRVRARNRFQRRGGW